MLKAPIGSNEKERLEKLLSYQVLDTVEEQIFDDITKLASLICEVPIALVSLVDKDRQWFKSHHGIDARETPRDVSFCGHAIQGTEIFVVQSADQDERFKDNPLAAGAPFVKFYAGVPLVSPEGFAVGTLCVIDHKPNQINEFQIKSLKSLAQHVVNVFEYRLKNQNTLEINHDLNTLLENMTEGMVVQDSNGKIHEFNKSALKILGLTEGQLIGRDSMDPNWRAIKDNGEDFPGEQHPAMMALKTGKPQQNAMMGLPQSDNKIRWININSIPIFKNNSQTPTHALTTFADVTFQRQAVEESLQLQEKLQNQERFLNQLLKTLPVMVAYLDADLKFMFVNSACEIWLEKKSKEIIGHGAADVLGYEVLEWLEEPISKCLKGEAIDFEGFLAYKQDDMRSVYIRMVPDLDSDHKVNGIIFAIEDISEQKHTELELKQTLAALDESAMVALIDLKQNIIQVNDRFCKISGFKKEELIGTDITKQHSEFHSKSFFETLKNTIASGKVWSGELQGRKKDGELYWSQAYISPLVNVAGKVESFLSIRFDITKQKDLQAQMVYSSKMSSLGEMAGGMAHEINNPLSIIKGKAFQVKMLLENEKPDLVKINQIIDSLDSTVDRIATIVKGLKNFSRDGGGDPFGEVQLSSIITETLTFCSNRFRTHQAELNVEAIPIDLKFECRQVQISQVILNLLNNALDAIQDYPEKWVRLGFQKEAQYFDIIVEDSGLGIPKDIQDKILQPFFTTKKVGSGTGLGLSIAKGIIESHNGSLFIDNTSKHTCFVVRLPYKQNGLKLAS